ncbi:MAG: hypothetical protein LC808_12630 [Actinobacteria bacterium]|nr:hypothetical protein [Actinomycetota bacterium]
MVSYRDIEVLAERGIDVDPSSLVHTLRGMGSAQRHLNWAAAGHLGPTAG